MGVEPMKIGGGAWWETGGAMGAGPTGGMATAQPIGRGGGAGGGAWRGLTWGAESRRGEEAERRTAKSGGGVGGGSAPKLPVRHSPVLGPCGRGRAAVGGEATSQIPQNGAETPRKPPTLGRTQPRAPSALGESSAPLALRGGKRPRWGHQLGGWGIFTFTGGPAGTPLGGLSGAISMGGPERNGWGEMLLQPPPPLDPPLWRAHSLTHVGRGLPLIAAVLVSGGGQDPQHWALLGLILH